jgi:hypothetical protein
MAFLLTYSVEIDDDVYADAYQMFDCKLSAYTAFDKIVDVDDIYCVSVSEVIRSTEPKWEQKAQITHHVDQKRLV